jgi:hypothetical protein
MSRLHHHHESASRGRAATKPGSKRTHMVALLQLIQKTKNGRPATTFLIRRSRRHRHRFPSRGSVPQKHTHESVLAKRRRGPGPAAGSSPRHTRHALEPWALRPPSVVPLRSTPPPAAGAEPDAGRHPASSPSYAPKPVLQIVRRTRPVALPSGCVAGIPGVDEPQLQRPPRRAHQTEVKPPAWPGEDGKRRGEEIESGKRRRARGHSGLLRPGGKHRSTCHLHTDHD